MIWKLLRSVTTTFLGLLLVAGAVASVPFFIPPQSYHASVERLLSDGLGREVHVRELRYRLLPLPHISGAGITITSALAPGEAVIQRVDLWPDLEALLHGRALIKRAHFSGIAANRAFIDSFANSVNLTGAKSATPPITVARVTASTVLVRDDSKGVHGPFSFDGHFGGNGAFQHMQLALEDGSLELALRPLGPSIEIRATGHEIMVPGAISWPIRRLTASAVLTQEALHITQFTVQSLGGWAEGDLRLHWSDAGSVIEGRSHVHNLPLRELRRWTKDVRLSGTASGLLEFTATGESLAALPRAVAVVADMSVQDAAADIGTPVFESKHLQAQVTLTTQVNGPSSLSSLLANMSVRGEATASEGRFLAGSPLFVFTQIHAQGTVDRHTAWISRADAAAYDGSILVTNTGISWQGKRKIEGHLQTKGISLVPLLEAVDLGHHFSGALTSDVDISLTANDWSDLFRDPQIKGHATLQRAVLRNPGFETLPIKSGNPWLTLREVDVDGHYANQTLSLTRARVAAYDGTATARDLVLSWRQDWRLTTRLEAQAVPIATVLSRFTDQTWLDGVLSADVDVALAAVTPQQWLDAPRIEGTVTVAKGRVLRLLGPHEARRNTVDETDSWLVFDAASAGGSLQSNRLNLASLQVRAYGGEFSSTQASVDWSSGWSAAGPLTVSTVQLEPLLKPFLTESAVTGELNGQFQVKLQGPTLDTLTDSVGLTGDFYASDGAIFKGDLSRAGTGLGPEDSKGRTEFQVLSGSVFARQGAVRVRNLHLESTSMSADGELRIAPDQQLSGNLTIAAKGTGPFTLPLNVAGTVDEPRYSLSRGALVGGAIGTTVFGPGFGTLIGVQTGRVLSVLGSLFSHNKEKIEQERAEEEAL